LYRKLRYMMWSALLTTSTLATMVAPRAMAAGTSGVSGITNPIASSGSTVGSVTNSAMTDVIYFVSAISGGWFLFHLYKGVMGLMAGSKNAQKREEAKSHISHIVISGIVLGGAVTFASAIMNLGASLK
jgi:Type IV secretion system pilin